MAAGCTQVGASADRIPHQYLLLGPAVEVADDDWCKTSGDPDNRTDPDWLRLISSSSSVILS